MEQITGIIESVNSRQVNTKDGPKPVYSLKLEGDSRRFDTWNGKLAGVPIGTQAEITFETQQNGQYTNYKITGIKPASSSAAPANGTPAPSQAIAAPPQQSSLTGKKDLKDVLMSRMNASKTAFGIIGELYSGSGEEIGVVLNEARVLTDEILHYVDTGEWYAGKPEPQGGWKWDGKDAEEATGVAPGPPDIPTAPEQPASADGGVDWAA